MLFAVVFFLQTQLALGAEAQPVETLVPIEKANCILHIKEMHKTGTFETQQFLTQTKTKQECQAMANIHKVNLRPETVEKVLVTAHFLGPVPGGNL